MVLELVELKDLDVNVPRYLGHVEQALVRIKSCGHSPGVAGYGWDFSLVQETSLSDAKAFQNDYLLS